MPAKPGANPVLEVPMKLLGPAAIAALVLIAGCSKSGGGAPNTAAGAPAPAQPAAQASGPDTPITVADLPRLKAGLWESSTVTDGGPAEVSRTCETGEPIKSPPQDSGCTQISIKRTFLGAVVFDMTCATGPVSSSVHATVTGDFNGSYSSDTMATITMQGQPPKTIKTHSDVRYIGPCTPGADG
jgi:hypothetical protein